MDISEFKAIIKDKDLDKLNHFLTNQVEDDPQTVFKKITEEEEYLFIIKHFKLTDKTVSNIMFDAYLNDKIEFFKNLIYKYNADPSVYQNVVLNSAAKEGKIGFLKMIAKHPNVDPSAHNNEALKSAIIKKQEDCALYLVRFKEVYEGKDIENALKHAYINEMFGVVDFLWKHNSIRKKLKAKNQKFYDKIYTVKNLKNF